MSKRGQSGDESAERPEDGRIKTGFSLTRDAHHRLALAKVVDKKTGDQIINELIIANLTGYYAGRRAKASQSEDGEAA